MVIHRFAFWRSEDKTRLTGHLIPFSGFRTSDIKPEVQKKESVPWDALFRLAFFPQGSYGAKPDAMAAASALGDKFAPA